MDKDKLYDNVSDVLTKLGEAVTATIRSACDKLKECRPNVVEHEARPGYSFWIGDRFVIGLKDTNLILLRKEDEDGDVDNDLHALYHLITFGEPVVELREYSSCSVTDPERFWIDNCRRVDPKTINELAEKVSRFKNDIHVVEEEVEFVISNNRFSPEARELFGV